MPTNTNVTNLKINTLTEAQYDTAVQGGVIGANELSFIIDEDIPSITPTSYWWTGDNGGIPAAVMTASRTPQAGDVLYGLDGTPLVNICTCVDGSGFHRPMQGCLRVYSYDSVSDSIQIAINGNRVTFPGMLPLDYVIFTYSGD